MLGRKYGKALVIERVKGDKYIIQCECGKKRTVTQRMIELGYVRGCTKCDGLRPNKDVWCNPLDYGSGYIALLASLVKQGAHDYDFYLRNYLAYGGKFYESKMKEEEEWLKKFTKSGEYIVDKIKKIAEQEMQYE